MNEFLQITGLLGNLIRAVGFLIFGFGITRFTMNAYNKANWQLQAALALGFFGLLVGLTNYATPGSSGMYALGSGISLLSNITPKKADDTNEEQTE
ncbi:MAG TPA: hypothetical protein VJ987_05270 [Anaerolineales bacterium]|nr:hypothetical protein [Anaerolineales bacterium]